MITLNVDKKQHGDNVRLSWKDTGGGNYSYRVFRRKVSNSLGTNEVQEEFVPIGVFDIEDATDSVSILNLHPNCGNPVTFIDHLGQEKVIKQSEYLQKWMLEATEEAPAGYGLGRMSITSCPISEFNVEPEKRLFYENGVAKYDVVCVGFYDSANRTNLKEQLTVAAVEEIRKFIDEGYGVLASHDYIGGAIGINSGLGIIRDLFGVTIGQWGTGGVFDHTFTSKFESNKLEISKSGSLMLYPWSVGTLEDEIKITQTHTTSQFTHSDIWLSFKDPTITGEAYLDDSYKRLGNCYLTTKKSTAMTQVGHTHNIQNVEKKILANTIFSLKQNTDKRSFIDSYGIDDEKPIQPSIIKHYIDEDQALTTFDFRCEDVGVNVEYYVEGSNKRTSKREQSNIVKTSFTSGLDKYKYKLNRIESDIVNERSDEWQETKDKTITLMDLDRGYYSFQIFAVDKSLNKSNIKEVIFYMPGKVVREKSPATTKYPNVQRVNNRYRGPHESKKANDVIAQVIYNVNNLKDIIKDLEKQKATMLERPSVDYLAIEERKNVVRDRIRHIRRTNARVSEPNIK